jgi:hypothetical protein
VIPFDHPSYQTHFDPIGCVQSQENWVELDSTEFPQFERVFYASCIVGNKIYTHGGLQDDYALDSFYVYDIGMLFVCFFLFFLFVCLIVCLFVGVFINLSLLSLQV